VADLKDEDPWIPGQQLYGCMIPRPEDDEEIHREEAIVGERIMKAFQDRVKEIKDAEGLSEYERKQLLKLGVHVNSVPMAFGYEVTPLLSEQGEEEEQDTDDVSSDGNNERVDFVKSLSSRRDNLLPSLSSSRVAVKLTSDKEDFVDNRESKDLVLESDGKTTYCISEPCTSQEGGEEQEEGLEVIGLGRYNTMGESTESFEEELLLADSNESLEVDDRLCRKFASNSKNSRIKVAYCYRPSSSSSKVEIDENSIKIKDE
jgi:hypothetical protein